jgi:hypothetical protein
MFMVRRSRRANPLPRARRVRDEIERVRRPPLGKGDAQQPEVIAWDFLRSKNMNVSIEPIDPVEVDHLTMLTALSHERGGHERRRDMLRNPDPDEGLGADTIDGHDFGSMSIEPSGVVVHRHSVVHSAASRSAVMALDRR